MLIHAKEGLAGRGALLPLLLTVMLGVPLCAVAADPLSVPRPGYVLGPNDVIRIQVFGEEDLTVEGKVGGDGKINFPLLGALEVGGRTVQELREDLTVRLAQGYVRQPNVTVYLLRYRNFYVGGEVKTPGGYPYEEGLTVQKAISIAGGFTEKAEPSGIKVTRLSEIGVEMLSVTPDVLVAPGDIVAVDTQRHKFYVSGEVKTPGGYPYKDGLNIQKAIAMAGGLTEKADRVSTKVVRLVNGREETLSVMLNTPVLAEDTVVVAEGQRFYVSGEVKTPGRYLYEPGITVQKAISIAGGFTEKADRVGMNVTRVNGNGVQTLPAEPDALVLPDDLIVVARTHKIYVNGEVRKPGDYPYEKGLTIHKAITMAGGFTDKAAEGSAKVLRVIDGQEQSVRVKLEDLVLPEDIIVVPKRFF